MSYELTLLIGYRYEYGLEYDIQPFRTIGTISIGALHSTQRIADLKYRADRGDFGYPQIELLGLLDDGDTKYIKDSYEQPLYAVPYATVLTKLRYDARWFKYCKDAIALIESMSHHYERLEVVLYGE